MKKKREFAQNFKKRALLLLEVIKKILNWGKDTAIKIVLQKKVISIGLSVLAIVMLLLGLSIDWQCGSKGWNCEGEYTPPAPDDVNKILKQSNNK